MIHSQGNSLLRLAALVALLVAVLGVAPVAQAATFNIADGDVTALINAINTANGNGQPDTINLAAGGTYTLTAVDNGIDGPNGLPSITSVITINGNGATIERSSAGSPPDFRIFHVADTGSLTLNDLTITNGDPGANSGGGIYNEGTLKLENVTVKDNDAGGDGGGICNAYADLTLTNSTVSGNTANNDGGGIYNAFAGLTLTNSTVSGNTANNDGGGIYNYTDKGDIEFKNTVIANNAANEGPDCGGYDLDSYGYNLVEDTTDCTINEVANPGTDITGQDPNLGPLQDNGGPTFTHALLPGSPAIDAALDCTLVDGTTPVTEDQRGEPRPADGDQDGTAVCDIGAYEVQPPPPPPEPVGGVIVPVNRLGLLLPWLGLAAVAGLAALTVALGRRRGG